MESRKLVTTALFMAVGVISAHLVYIPIGAAKCFPVQHAINILLAVGFGTRYAVSGAFGISLLRNVLGTGTLLAFPGSMIGAFLAGVLYKKTGHILGAVAGELIGTGVLGALTAYAVAKFLLGSQAGAFFLILPFMLSSAGGSLLALFFYRTPVAAMLRGNRAKGAAGR